MKQPVFAGVSIAPALHTDVVGHQTCSISPAQNESFTALISLSPKHQDASIPVILFNMVVRSVLKGTRPKLALQRTGCRLSTS